MPRAPVFDNLEEVVDRLKALGFRWARVYDRYVFDMMKDDPPYVNRRHYAMRMIESVGGERWRLANERRSRWYRGHGPERKIVFIDHLVKYHDTMEIF